MWPTTQTTASSLHQIQHNHVTYKPNNSMTSVSDSAQPCDLQTKQQHRNHMTYKPNNSATSASRFSTIIWPTNQTIAYDTCVRFSTVMWPIYQTTAWNPHQIQHNHMTYKPNNSIKSTLCDLQTKQKHHICLRISTTTWPTNQITVLHLHQIQHNHMTYKPNNGIKALVPLLHEAR